MTSGDVGLYYVKCLLFNKNTVGSVYLRILNLQVQTNRIKSIKSFFLFLVIFP